MSARTCLAIVLAAGEGTRMRSSRPKVLHSVAGRSLLAHVLAALRTAGGGQSAVVVGPDRDDVAAEAQRAIAVCNGGLMAFNGKHALSILDKIGHDNRKGEFYLTDAVAIARTMGLRAAAIEVAEDEVSGINTKAQLAEAEAVIQQR